jgi:hypothetical protein
MQLQISRHCRPYDSREQRPSRAKCKHKINVIITSTEDSYIKLTSALELEREVRRRIVAIFMVMVDFK